MIRFLKKYGVFTGLIGIIRYFGTHLEMKLDAWVISHIAEEHFYPHINVKSDDLYEGDVELDVSRIMAGERKILFYDENDPNCLRDIKFYWEKKRLHEVYVLGLSDSKEVKAFLQKYLNDETLLGFDTSDISMEVAIRAINVCVAVSRCDSKCNLKVVSSFLKNAVCYILNHPERGVVYSGNHYFFNLLGILWILNHIDDRVKLLKIMKIRYLRKLEGLLTLMLQNDGSTYECTTHYHKYLTESLLEFLYFNEECNTDTLIKKATEMSSFCKSIAINDMIIGIGDNDSGRLLPLPNYFHYNSASIETINLLCKRLGIHSAKRETNMFGLYQIQDKNWRIALRADSMVDKKKNVAIGNHGHNDQLAIYLWCQNKPVFIDYGTYLYISENGYRLENIKAENHNTIVFEGIEQNVLPNGFDYVPRTATAFIQEKKETLVSSVYFDRFENYAKRFVSIENENVHICDVVSRSADNDVYEYFWIDYHWKVINEAQNIVKVIDGSNVLTIKSSNKIEVLTGYISPEYGLRKKTTCLKIGPFIDDSNHTYIKMNPTQMQSEERRRSKGFDMSRYKT